MNKLIFIILTVASSAAMADWVKVFTSEDNKIKYYADPPSKHDPQVDTVKMWSMNDLNAVQSVDSKAYLSVVLEKEYNCKDKQDRLFYSAYHSGNMGGREVLLAKYEDKKWTPIKPNTPGDALWEIACHSVTLHTSN